MELHAVRPLAASEASESRPPPFEVVYRDLWPEMLRVARLLTGSLPAAEEVAQEAFLGLYRNYGRVEHPRAYLRRSLVHGITTARRRQPAHEPLSAAPEPVVHPPELDETWQALASLTTRQRAVVVLRYYEDLPLTAIADTVGCSVGTVKSTLSRSLARLRKELS